MNDRYEQFRQLERAAEGRWAEIIRALSCVDISDAIHRRRHVRCHRDHGKTNAQFRVFRDFEQTGGGICNTCGAFSNGFALLGFLNGWDYKQSVKEVAQYLEGRVISAPPRPSLAPQPRTWEVSEENLQRLRDVWHSTERLAGSTGETYLRNRGIECDLPDEGEVRFHRRLDYWDQDRRRSLGLFPGIVSMMRSPESGEPLTLHRTYLTWQGEKARVPCPKKLMSAAVDGVIRELGAAIRLYPLDGDCLAITEGIETALAVRSAHPGLPVWACYSASVLTSFRPPEGVQRVLIWGDLDESGAGQIAAAKLAIRLRNRGIESRVILPGDGLVYVKDDPNLGWYSRDESRADLVACLKANDYDVTDVPGPSIDWLDVWCASQTKVKAALEGMIATDSE
jgi:putative DNA primase/helicase